jgi:hypothetical protein
LTKTLRHSGCGGHRGPQQEPAADSLRSRWCPGSPPTWAVKFWSATSPKHYFEERLSAAPSVTDASEGTSTPWTSWP